jgi:phenylacetate-CoA ligase
MLQRLLQFFVITPVSSYVDLASQLSIIEKARPDVLDGYSNSLVLLAKEVRKRKINTIKPRLVIGGAELISTSSRRFIEETFDVPFYDQYACIELERVAWQCKEKAGYHVDADSLIMQFVDENGEEVARGERGEIVCTSLFNQAMPLIRYVVGDVGAASEESQCGCGRSFPLMKIVEGRKDSFIILPDGRILAPTGILGALDYMNCFSTVDQFRIVQKKKDLLNVQIKLKDPSGDSKLVEASFLDVFRNALMVDAKEVSVQVDFLDEIPPQRGGKFSSIVSELNQPAGMEP